MRCIKNAVSRAVGRARLFSVGFFMGMADLVPGVSGGTIALLSGVYAQLLEAITAVTGPALKKLVQGNVRGAIAEIPFAFLLPLGAGILCAIFSLAHLLTILLERYPSYVWSLFFGLVLASTYVVLLRTTLRRVTTCSGFVLGALLGFVVVGMVPIQTSNTPLVVFGSGVIAISAMILPGISGSFMLVIMGQYKNILSAVTSLDMVTLGVFVAGCFTGLAFFVRFLSWVLSRYHHVTLAVLAGLMFGSLRKLWPWKEVVETRIDETGILVPLIEKNVIPHAMDMSVLGALLLCSLGIVLVLLFQKEKQKNG